MGKENQRVVGEGIPVCLHVKSSNLSWMYQKKCVPYRINVDDRQAYEEDAQEVDELVEVISSNVTRLIKDILFPGDVQRTEYRKEVYDALLNIVWVQRRREEIAKVVRRGVGDFSSYKHWNAVLPCSRVHLLTRTASRPA